MNTQTSAAPTIREDLQNLYEDYFDVDPHEQEKNRLAAVDTVNSIQKLYQENLGSCIDFGAGDGVVTGELYKRGITKSLTVLEISTSGIERIKALNIISDSKIIRFDGYNVPALGEKFDTLVCSHVIEHVEHERIILKTMTDLARNIFLIVPLEGGVRGAIDRSGGHINYYTPLTFLNLIETSGLSVINSAVYPSSKAYEQHIYGNVRGSVKNIIRQVLLNCIGSAASELMTYNMVVHCTKAPDQAI
jgi:hypothetical protein